MSPLAAQFLSLDYLYFAAPDIDAAIRFYTEALGGALVWRIRHHATTVAAVRLTEPGPLVLLANHLAPGQGLAIYRVASLSALREQLSQQGFSPEGEPFELPQGPCIVLRDPGQQRLAAYERVRHVDEHFAGRFDS
jgi:catechol 2,3-dioxygenase-like lactoylglutathione lyase family enzyme